MNLPKIIQGGMGVAVSSWELAHRVSELGQLGVVSGTGIAIVLIARLMDGDPGGHAMRALKHFPYQDVAQKIIDKYYDPDGKPGPKFYKRPPMWSLKPSIELQQVTVVANFVEVWLAKQEHGNAVGINLLEKVQLPTMASLYGAMLADVDVVIMGAGIPFQIPGILDKLSVHKPVSYRVDVENATADDDIRLHFDPEECFPGIGEKLPTLQRPNFYPIISSNVLAMALVKRATGTINGFVVETPIAGGHNAPPRGAMKLNERGEPIYGDKDMVDLDRLHKMGLPFWLAGGYGNPEQLEAALEAGAAGVQVGTAFAHCDESGMDPVIREMVLERVCNGTIELRTDARISPTGYPFKVVQLPTTIADPKLMEERPRLCDVGYLRHLYKMEDGSIGFRCPSEPIDDYVRKGGDIEDTVGRGCLCNHLGSAAGFKHVRKRNGYQEPPVVTSGDDIVNIGRILKSGQKSYNAEDVINFLTRDGELLK